MHIYREATLALSPLGGISSHPSILWGLELPANDESTIGVNVFTLGGAGDSGKVFNEVELPLRPDQSMEPVHVMIDEEAASCWQNQSPT